MSISPVATPAPVEQAQIDESQHGAVGGEGGIDGLDKDLNELSLEGGLHRACAEGKLDEVRVVLTRSLEGLEVQEPSTGCTPVVLAIRNNHYDVVRELLTAGAILPQQHLTSDPTMLSILYPQPPYGFQPPPPQFMGATGYSNDFYPQPGPGFYPSHSRKDVSPNGGNGANLPPVEVAKTIPCRNFPNCKYGSSCAFFHPGAFYPNGPAYYDVPQHQNGFTYQNGGMPVPGPYYFPNGYGYPDPNINQHQQHQQLPEQHQQPVSEDTPALNDTQHDQLPVPIPAQSVPSAVAPVFVPMGMNIASPPPPSQFGLSPMSPSMLVGSLPSIPPADQFFAGPGSPPNQLMSPPNPFIPNGHARSHSFSQQQQLPQPFVMPYKAFNGKKPSFSGGPRPFGPRASVGGMGGPGMGANLGSWKDGVPPPCAFFVQGKCRNGELCKFPHIDEQGNDCRHPDIIRGIIAPLPTMRQPRNMRMPGNFGPFDPSFRAQQQQQQQLHFLQQQRAAAAQAQNGVDQSSIPAITETSAETQTDKPSLPSSVPAKPSTATTNPPAPLPTIVRSASQPGVARVSVHGFTSRSHSPAPSNVSFHGNGHPRRAGSRVPFPNGSGNVNGDERSASVDRSGKSQSRQRVPGADEFPALGGAPTSPNAAQQAKGKTSAQVLSAPAPVKAAAKAGSTNGDAESANGSEQNSVTMSSESESDAVLISHKSTPAPASPQPKIKRNSSVSFANVGLAKGLESHPVEIRA